MIVLKDKVQASAELPKVKPIGMYPAIKFEDGRLGSREVYEPEESFWIASDASYRPLEYVKNMGW